MDYLQMNRKAWDQRTEVHLSSKFYDVSGFLIGNSSLKEIELSELAPLVQGKQFLHLQCHFGLDTLSWARLGAHVTGVDLSPKAIQAARELSQKINIESQFIEADIYQFARSNTQQFDIVYCSYGAICWLPDIQAWADTIASKLRKGGIFYMVEFHPIYDLLVGFDYFHQSEPDISEEASYVDPNGDGKSKMATWAHPISDVITSLIDAGLDIEFLHEFDYSPYDCFEGLIGAGNGRYHHVHHVGDIKHNSPLTYSIKARRR
ncbi:class I SAM-dependent methyltransferase [Alginatibacterium sediminis]|uniref:Class I SAM-dependent methyltransferase n=1 Tax=Alginatibacterium sediminis TaxID=2164068 RepID=A0A420E5X7_9ALTE|nr:class I SAM-dependent methyltransferase [Alginatibacterium sediminis]RKF13259.1 class I SAM-dependent methyltransferase [Alginatibacterium sediminis]